MSKLIPRTEIYDLYWYFAHERNEIFYRKLNGDPQPWTEDPILQEYKFTNTYRVNDRVSQFLLRNVIYNGKEYSPEDTIFRIVLFKLFNKESTWVELEKKFGEITLDNYDVNAYADLLDKVQEVEPIFSNAYMLRPIHGKAESKHKNYLIYFEKIFRQQNLAEKILKCKNMREAFDILNKMNYFGNFLAYQYATDINYSEAVDWQETDFTIPGGGALRGIGKVFESLNGMDPSAAVWHMYENQEEEFAKRGYEFRKLGGKRRMQPIDCQNVFCEVDKYCRVAHPELKTGNVKIKAKYTTPKPKIDYLYPPKWKL